MSLDSNNLFFFQKVIVWWNKRTKQGSYIKPNLNAKKTSKHFHGFIQFGRKRYINLKIFGIWKKIYVFRISIFGEQYSEFSLIDITDFNYNEVHVLTFSHKIWIEQYGKNVNISCNKLNIKIHWTLHITWLMQCIEIDINSWLNCNRSNYVQRSSIWPAMYRMELWKKKGFVQKKYFG